MIFLCLTYDSAIEALGTQHFAIVVVFAVGSRESQKLSEVISAMARMCLVHQRRIVDDKVFVDGRGHCSRDSVVTSPETDEHVHGP